MQFLVEIGTEELPPSQLQNLSKAFTDNILKNLTESKIKYTEYKSFASPRRIAMTVNISEFTESSSELKKGPSLKAVKDKDGNYTKAALGFAKSCNTDIENLTTLETEKGSWLSYNLITEAKPSFDILPNIINKSVNQIKNNKTMFWNTGEYSFVRPVHWICSILNNKVVPVNIFGIESSNKTYGHRFHFNNPITINNPTEYEENLLSIGFVTADFDKRKQNILEQINQINIVNNFNAIVPDDLLNYVTSIVEYPNVLIGEFEKDFLNVPKECLISAMEDHQKCFHVLDKNNNLLNKFILVSNINSYNPEKVVYGNERVINARLADAAFLYKEDKKIELDTFAEKLKTVVFQNKLGTTFDKIKRIENIAIFLSKKLNSNTEFCKRAAYLAKADLLSQMVYEFPELQGIMGYYYAKDKEENDVAIAIKEHYLPKFADDTLPSNDIASIIAIADRIDTIVGMFSINKVPTGEKDPFALRRQALAILIIIIKNNLDINLQDLIKISEETYNLSSSLENKILDFFSDRLKPWYNSQSINPEVFNSIDKKYLLNPIDFNARVNAVNTFLQSESAKSLAAANKRVYKILSKEKQENFSINLDLLEKTEEKILHKIIKTKQQEIEPLIKNKNYSAILESLSILKQPIDDFFDNIMVMSDDINIKNNRLALLYNLRNLFLSVADFSVL